MSGLARHVTYIHSDKREVFKMIDLTEFLSNNATFLSLGEEETHLLYKIPAVDETGKKLPNYTVLYLIDSRNVAEGANEVEMQLLGLYDQVRKIVIRYSTWLWKEYKLYSSVVIGYSDVATAIKNKVYADIDRQIQKRLNSANCSIEINSILNNPERRYRDIALESIMDDLDTPGADDVSLCESFLSSNDALKVSLTDVIYYLNSTDTQLIAQKFKKRTVWDGYSNIEEYLFKRAFSQRLIETYKKRILGIKSYTKEQQSLNLYKQVLKFKHAKTLQVQYHRAGKDMNFTIRNLYHRDIIDLCDEGLSTFSIRTYKQQDTFEELFKNSQNRSVYIELEHINKITYGRKTVYSSPDID